MSAKRKGRSFKNTAGTRHDLAFRFEEYDCQRGKSDFDGLALTVPGNRLGGDGRVGHVGAAEFGSVTVQDFARSEEHTSELQSRENLVCRLLLEKKKQN